MNKKIDSLSVTNTQNIVIENVAQDNVLQTNDIQRDIRVVGNANTLVPEKIALFDKMVVELPHREVVKWYEDNVKDMSQEEIKHMKEKVYPCIRFDAQARLDNIKKRFGDQVEIYVKKTSWSGIKEVDISLTGKNILSVDLEWFLNKIQGIPLGSLKFIDCENMKEVDLSNLYCVEKCSIKNCNLLKKVIMPNNARNVRVLHVKTCQSLEEIEGLSKCQFIQEIKISDIGSLERCPDLSALTELRILEFADMSLGPDDGEFLIELPGLSQLKNLEVLSIDRAGTGLRNADELSELTHLKELVLCDPLIAHVYLNGLRLLNHPELKKISMDLFNEKMDISGAVNLEYLDVWFSDCDIDLSDMHKLKKVEFGGFESDNSEDEDNKKIIISRNCPFAQEPEAQDYPFVFDDEIQVVQGSIYDGF